MACLNIKATIGKKLHNISNAAKHFHYCLAGKNACAMIKRCGLGKPISHDGTILLNFLRPKYA